MKPRLIILSDLWGTEESEWIESYIQRLRLKYDIHYYDCCELGKVDKTLGTEHSLHTQFVNDGIATAVQRLLELEDEAVEVLAFSIGGVIAWKAQRLGLKITTLHAISSTRLRYETQQPNCKFYLYFGENDDYKPSANWYSKMKLEPKLLKNKAHNFYIEIECIDEICRDYSKVLENYIFSNKVKFKNRRVD